MLRSHEQRVLTLLINVQAYEKKTDVAAVTSLLESRKQTDSMNQENHQPALVAPAMTSYLRHDCVDHEPGMPKIKTETMTYGLVCPLGRAVILLYPFFR